MSSGMGLKTAGRPAGVIWQHGEEVASGWIRATRDLGLFGETGAVSWRFSAPSS